MTVAVCSDVASLMNTDVNEKDTALLFTTTITK